MRSPLVCVVALLTLAGCRRSDDNVRPDPAKCPACPSVVATASVPKAIPLDPPMPEDGSKLTPILHVDLDAKGDVFFAGKAVALADVESAARSQLAKDPSMRVVIAADSRVQHGRVIALLDTLKKAGVTKIAFAVAPVSSVGSP